MFILFTRNILKSIRVCIVLIILATTRRPTKMAYGKILHIFPHVLVKTRIYSVGTSSVHEAKKDD
jgi:hypothetical protein